MERQIDMDQVSDGKRYGLNDMVKAGCNDCQGCWACCQGMGTSIVLDPLDMFRLEQGLKQSFAQLTAGPVELNVAEGMILPNLKMEGEQEACAFLSQEGRCSIHEFRPGFCRMFPLGRIYENGSFQYFLQIHECPAENKTKVKVKRWIDTPDVRRNEEFIIRWHYFIKELQEWVRGRGNQEEAKKLNLFVLKQFYVSPYDLDGDFYQQFHARMDQALKMLGMSEPGKKAE